MAWQMTLGAGGGWCCSFPGTWSKKRLIFAAPHPSSFLLSPLLATFLNAQALRGHRFKVQGASCLESLRAQGAPLPNKGQRGASLLPGPGKAGRPSENPEHLTQMAYAAWINLWNNHGRSFGGEAQAPGTPLLPGSWPVSGHAFPFFS